MLASWLVLIAIQGAPEGISVEVQGMGNDKGVVRCVIYAATEASAFPKKPENSLERVEAKIEKGRASCHLRAPAAPGEYAVGVFHDENNNGVLDKNFLGRPKEAVGASNDPPAQPPTFDTAKFSWSGKPLTLWVTLKYP